MSETFSYDSLFIEADLTSEDRAIFNALNNTTNFERALQGLATAMRVDRALGRARHDLRDIYNRIRYALMDTVVRIHIERWQQTPEQRLHINTYLRRHQAIFSTNYDLLLYWALMAENSDDKFVDFFWTSDCRFDPGRVEIFDPASIPVYYLHGALHIYRAGIDIAAKRTARTSRLLVEATSRSARPALFVSEGSHTEKRAAIDASSYLRFTYQRFESDDRDLVIFGHALDPDQDGHIIDAINAHPGRRIAVSVHGTSAPYRLHVQRIFADCGHDISFFSSRSHPLGDTSLSIHAGP